MAEYVLKAQQRTVTGKKVRRLRTEGVVPFVVYGPRQEPVNLQANYRDLEVTLLKAGGTNLVDIEVEGGETYSALARDVQRDPIKATIKHVDFFAIDESARVVIDVPIYMHNQSAAVAARKAILLTGPSSLRLEMKAVNLRNRIDIDLSEFPSVGDSLYVKDLTFDENTRVLNDPEEMVLRISQSSAARREEALAMVEAGAGMDASPDVEVIGESDDE
ncbi:MAG: 50S ribosomal protein L25 [Chloroflexota bacterium]